MTEKLQDNTVQQTLCIPLRGRMLATKKFPNKGVPYEKILLGANRPFL
jgi:hypothetical protein